MAAAGYLFTALTVFLVLTNGCVARQSLGVPPQLSNECNLDNLNVLEPSQNIETEAGRIEYWDHNNPQLRCAGVSVSRIVIEQKGLYLPTFFASPHASYVVQGMGVSGRVVPGCAETFMDSQPMGQQGQQGQEGQEEGQQGFRDMHQKVENIRQGDVLVTPPGTAQWIYNSGNQPLVIISLLDIANVQNQLDRNPRVFRLAGNNQQQSSSPFRKGEQQEQQEGMNIFSGFDTQILAQALKISPQLAQQLQNQQDNRGNIVRVKGPFQVVRPPPREQGPQGNGLEETICSMKCRENIDDPSLADVYKPQLGRVTTINRHTMPILQYVKLSATRGVLHRNAMVIPKYNMNANEILYCTSGQARIQVVNDNGQNVLDQQVQKGQLVVLPQGFAFAIQSHENNFEWISFKTNDNAMISTLAGRTSALRALPLQVITNAYQISLEEARRIKFNTLETTLTQARGQHQLIEEIVQA